MGRALRFLSDALIAAVVLLAASLPALAQSTAMKSLPNAGCAAQACTATSAAQYCVQGPVVFVCDTGTSRYVPVGSWDVGQKINLEGWGGDTYMIFDADTRCLQQWRDGALGWQLCNGYVVPPPCSSYRGNYPFFALCGDPDTGNLMVKAHAVVPF